MNKFGDYGALKHELSKVIAEGSPLLPTAQRAANNLLVAIDGVLGDDLSGVESDTKIGLVKAHSITKALDELGSVLRNDMPGIAVYIVSKKGIYNTDDLITHAEKQLPPEIVKGLPPRAKIDLQEAGRCLAYEAATACAFHYGVLLNLSWRNITRTLPEARLRQIRSKQTWASYINVLTNEGADPKITIFLDHIRTEYRNPQTHPDAEILIDQAQGLFGVAITSIHQMISETTKTKSGSVNQSVSASSS